MVVNRFGQAQQFLQQAMHGSGSKKIQSPHNMGHALQGIIQCHTQMVTCRCIDPPQDDIAPLRRICRNDSAMRMARFLKRQWPVQLRQRLAHIQTPAVFHPRPDPVLTVAGAATAVKGRIMR